jgi:hypothetical protein
MIGVQRGKEMVILCFLFYQGERITEFSPRTQAVAFLARLFQANSNSMTNVNLVSF